MGATNREGGAAEPRHGADEEDQRGQAGGEKTVGDAGGWPGPEPAWYSGPREDSLPQVRRVRGDARGPPQRSDQGQVGETQESLSRGAKEIVHFLTSYRL